MGGLSRTSAWVVAAIILLVEPAAAGEVPFSNFSVIASESADPTAVTAADLDGDGDLEALVGFEAPLNLIVWYENLGADDGSGSCGFITSACLGNRRTISSAVDTPRLLRGGDIDGDGDMDVLSTSTVDDEIAWYENLGPSDISTGFSMCWRIGRLRGSSGTQQRSGIRSM